MKKIGLHRQVLIVLGLLLPMMAVSQLSLPIQRGLDWLVGRIQSKTVLGEEQSRALPLQVRAEAVETLRALASMPMPLAEAVIAGAGAGTDADTETLARQILVGASAARDVQAELTVLAERQNADGGFGGGPGYASHALDTAWAVMAYAQAGQGAGTQAVHARAWLAGRLVTQGDAAGSVVDTDGVRSATPQLRIYTSAMVALALQSGAASGHAQAVQRVTAWLAAQQGADGGWASDPLLTAWVLLAISPSSSDSGMKSAASGFLQSRQAVDGSWGGDPYVTALALRALTVRPGGISTGDNSVSGVIRDGATGLPMEGASVALTVSAGSAPLSLSSSPSGEFTFNGVASGTWSLTVSRLGYQAQVIGVVVNPGQSVNIGILTMQPTFGSAQVKGVITAFDGGRSLAGALVAATVAGRQLTAISDTNGRFELNAVSPGSVNLTVSFSGYQTVSANAILSSAQTLLFSPVLFRNGSVANGPSSFLGRLLNAVNKLPLSAARVDLIDVNTGAAASTTSSADGTFNINLAASSYTVRYSANGFNLAEQRFVLTTGSALNVGDVYLSPQATNAELRGHVMGDNGEPVGNAKVVVSAFGHPSREAVSTADGSYFIGLIALGEAQIRVSAPGYLSRQASINFGTPGSYSVDFSLRRVAAAGIDVRIESFTTSTPQAPASTRADFTATIANGSLSARSARLELDLLDSSGEYLSAGSAINNLGQGQSDFLFPQGGRLAIPLLLNLPAAANGLYRVRLRVSDTDTLTLLSEAELPISVLPVLQRSDLLVSRVERGTAQTDAQSLRVNGKLLVEVRNVGDADLENSVSLLAFVDINRNRRFDEGTDTPVGLWRGPLKLARGAGQSLDLPVSGELPFRDAPIMVWVDSDERIAESNEANNIGSTADSAVVLPKAAAFSPKLKWHWTGLNSPFPDYNQVMMSPVVGRVIDTNNDGRIDNADHTVVAFVTFPRTGLTNLAEGVLRVVDGADGRELLTIRDTARRISAYSGLALADIDQDGRPEILALSVDGRLLAYSNEGALKWATAILIGGVTQSPFAAPIVVDIDGDGRPEVVVGRNVVNADGSLRWRASGSQVGSSISGSELSSVPIAADLFGTGQQNLILGGSVYGPSGQLLWANQDGYSAVGDFDGDGQAEIAVVRGGTLTLYRRTGERLWQVSIPGGGSGGPPTVADVDGNGVPDICVAGATAYSCFRSNGTVLWSSPIQDRSSNITGSTVFDFDGDGAAEVLYADERLLRVYRGRDGTVLWSLPNTSGTLVEYPIVADLDGDGHADLLAVSNDYTFVANAVSYTRGLRAFQDANNAWVNVRSIWNQHAYSITNINDDLIVPAKPKPSWIAHNTFRLNTTTGISPTAVSDVTAGFLRVATAEGGGLVVRARIGNAGARTLQAGAKVALIGQLNSGSVATLAVAALASDLAAGDWVDLEFPSRTMASLARIAVVADDDGNGTATTDDFDRSNNRVELDLVGFPLGLSVRVATDRPSYTADSPVLITVPVLNGGAGLSKGQVVVSVISPSGATMAQLGSFPTGDIASGATQVIAALWNSGATPSAAGYKARATLLDAQGRTVSTANATFDIVGQPATGVAARITTDRPSYAPSDTVQLTERIDNLQANTTIEGLVIRSTVRNASATTVWQRSEPLSQLSAGLYKQLSYSVTLANASAGRYSATMEVLDAAGVARATDATAFDVGSTAGSGAGLGGTLVALPKSVYYGDAVGLQWTLSNQGNSPFTALPVAVRILDPLATSSTQAVIAELPTSVPLGVGQSLSYIQSWTPGTAQVNKTLVAALVATVGGQTVTLAQDRVQVLEPPVRMDLATQLRKEARVLALVSCPGSEDSDGGDEDLTRAGPDSQSLIKGPDAVATVSATQTIPQSSSDGSDDGEDHGRDQLACSAGRAQALRASLAQLGLVHKVVSTRAEFETELRCGQYNTYWISGGSAKLSDSLARQLREAVRRGDSLLVEGPQDARNALLHPALGVKQTGTLAQRNLGLQFVADGLFPAGALATLGRPARFQLQGGVAQALFPASPVHDSLVASDSTSDSKSTAVSAPAIVSNVFGQGRTLLFAFDLAAMLTEPSGNAAVQDLLQRSLGHLAVGAAQPANIGEPVAVGLDVRNTGVRTASFRVALQLPVEARFMSASLGAQPDAQGRIVWNAQLAPGDVLPVTLRLGFGSAGAKTLNFTVQGGLNPEAWVVQQTAVFNLEVLPNSMPVTAALQQLQALAPTAAAERNARTAAISAATQAQALMSQQNFVQALPKWIAAAEALQDIRSLPTQAAALSLAQALQADQRALCPQLACLSGRLAYSVAGQGTSLIPLGSSPLQVRSVSNQCPAPFNGLGLINDIVNQTLGTSLLNLNQTLNLAPGQSQQRQDNWKAQDGHAGDTLQATLTASWQGLLQSLDVQALQLVVVPPKVTGTVSANPATVRRGSPVDIGRTLTNQGVAAQSVRYTVKLVNASKGNQLEQQWSDTLSLQPGQSSSQNWSYVPKASAGDSLRLELSVSINGATQALATATLNVTP